MLTKALDQPAQGAMVLASKLGRRRRLRLVEQADDLFFLVGGDRGVDPRGRFRFAAGAWVAEGRSGAAGNWRRAEVEVVLAERRFLFPRLQAPRKATEFLDAIVRSQIDRLTPWTRAQAEAGFAIEPSSGDEATVTLAAAAKATLAPYVEAARARGAAAVTVYAARAEGAPIRVFGRDVAAEARARNARRVLAVALAAAVVFALGAATLENWLAGQRDATEVEIGRRVAALRANAGGAEEDAVLAALIKRKRDNPPDVVVVEALSRALPDDSYLTQMRISGARLEIDGVSRSASSLVGRLEQTEPLQRAQFSAPTTSAATDGAEQFHIAADIVAASARGR